VKAYLLFRDQDFDFEADLPPGHQDLIQDLELTTLLQAMAAGDKFLYGVSAKVLLACLDDPEAICYRQRVLADCLAQPEVIRQMYAVATAALDDRRHIWGSSSSSLTLATKQSVLTQGPRFPERTVVLLAWLYRIKQGEHVAQRRFVPGQLRFPACRLGIGGGTQLRGGT
jgi:hypothetical protein